MPPFPSLHLVSCVLHHCRKTQNLSQVLYVHSLMLRSGLAKYRSLGNDLLSLLVDVGCMSHAQEAFHRMEPTSESLLSSLIKGYFKCGDLKHSLSLYKTVQEDDTVHLTTSTFVALLKACAKLKDVETGGLIHMQISRKGFLESDDFVGSRLIYMYAKCGYLVHAQEVFDCLPIQSIVSWTALIAAFVENGDEDMALHYLEQMQQEGHSLDEITYVYGLKACGNRADASKGREMHSEILSKGLEKCLVVGSTVVDMYAKCCLLPEAHEVFKKFEIHDVVSWTALIGGYSEHGNSEEALNCFKQMQDEGVSPDAGAFVCCLKACGNMKSSKKGRKLHANVVRMGLDHDIFVGSSLVDMYCKCGLLGEAQLVFDVLPVHNMVLWTALITGYVEHGFGAEALNCFQKMRHEGLIPGDATYICCMKGCGSVGATVKGEKIHAEVIKTGYESEILVSNTIVDMYAKCGLLTEARHVFEKLSVRTVVSWTSLLTGYAQLGESENVFFLLNRMVSDGVKPNFITFINVLHVCSHSGLVDTGQIYFELVGSECGFIPTPEHFACVVDLLARAGHINSAIELIRRMPFHPSIRYWLSVLGACRKWGNVESGQCAFEHAVRLDGKEVAAYVCMFNIYAHAAMQDDANELESMWVEIVKEELNT